MEHVRYYRNGGLVFESALPLDELATPCAPATPDVRVVGASRDEIAAFERTSDVVLAVGGEDDVAWMEVHRSADAYLVRWPEGLDVLMPDDGGSMRVHRRGDVADSIPRLLLCQSLSFILPAHGREGVHASAVDLGGVAVAIGGEPGRGKSTLATALCRAGGRLLADDLTVLRLQDGVPMVDPSSTKTWLLHEVAHAMNGNGNGAKSRVHKTAVGGHLVAESAVPLGAVYLLRFGDGAARVSEPIAGKEAVVHFLAALFNMLVASPRRLAVQFRISTEIAARVPIRTVHWQPGPDAAHALARSILEDASVNGGHMEPTIASGVLGAPVAANGNGRHEQRREILSLLRNAGVAGEVEDGMDEPLLRTSQVAALLRSSDRTVRSWADAGKLKYVKTLGGRRLFPASAVLSALRQMNAGIREEV